MMLDKTPSKLWITLVLALLAWPLVATSQPPADPPGERVRGEHARAGAPGERLFRNLRFLVDFLELTDEQIEQTRLLREDLQASIQPLREQGRDLRQELQAELEAGSPDALAVGNLVIEQHQLRQEMKALAEAAVEDFRSILTTEQQDLLDRLLESRPERPGRRGGQRGGP